MASIRLIEVSTPPAQKTSAAFFTYSAKKLGESELPLCIIIISICKTSHPTENSVSKRFLIVYVFCFEEKRWNNEQLITEKTRLCPLAVPVFACLGGF